MHGIVIIIQSEKPLIINSLHTSITYRGIVAKTSIYVLLIFRNN